MVSLPKHAIIYNHKQTEELLKHGRTSRGHLTGNLSFAKGNAHLTPSYGIPSYHPNTEASTSFANGLEINNAWDDATSALSDALDDAADSVNEFEETIDWIEIRMEEYDERINKFSAELENLTTYSSKNDKLDQIIEENKKKYADSIAGAAYYENYAKKYLEGMNDDLVAAAKNGAIAITEFTKEQDEATVEAIQNYRDYAQKAADLYQQAEEIITEIRDSVIQKIDNIQSYGDAKTSIEDLQTEKLQSAVDYLETSGYVPSTIYYGSNGGDAASSTGMFENSYKKIEYWQPLLDDMQAQLNEAVQNGQIKVGTIEWYEQIEKLYQVRAEIDAATLEIEEFQNAINDIYWDNFDQLISQYDAVQNETQNLIDLMANKNMIADIEKQTYKNGTVEFWTADDVKFTEEGIATLGLYAQQMEVAEKKAKQYEKAMEDLTADYEAGKYSQSEYFEKLTELKDGQYDAIKSYHDAKDAIVDLNKERIESVKEGIEKEIDAYDELIQKKKEELSAEQDLYDFQKSVQESSKNIADIERQLAALSGDNSASARAKRARLEAELAEAKADQEEMYYKRSIQDQQNALDKASEDFKESKEKEIEGLDKYIDNEDQVVADSVGLIKDNSDGINTTINDYADQYGLKLSDEVVEPWKDGSTAISDYQEKFGDATSSTTEQLDAMNNKWQQLITTMQEASEQEVTTINDENAKFAEAKEKTSSNNTSNQNKPNKNNEKKEEAPKPSLTAGSYVEVKPGTKWYADSYGGGASGTAKSGTIKYVNEKGSHAYNIDGLGWIKKTDIKGYSKGTTGLNKDQWSLFDELGLEELVMHAGPNGKLQYMTKGTSIVPHDITENLMELGQLDPSDVLNRNKPEITPNKSIVNNTMEINMQIAEVVHIDKATSESVPDISKAVEKQLNSYMSNLNNAIKAKVR